jgi:inhibitor of cysteine peptidase
MTRTVSGGKQRMKAKASVTAVMVTLLLAVVGCSPAVGASPAQEANIEVTIDEFVDSNHVVKEVEVAQGGVLTISLGSNPSTGFSWTENAEVAGPGVLRLSGGGGAFVAPEGEGLVGAPGNQTWTFEALEKGTTSISMEYGRPWEGGEKGVWTLELTVTVR